MVRRLCNIHLKNATIFMLAIPSVFDYRAPASASATTSSAWAKTCAAPQQFQGSTTSASRVAPSAISAQRVAQRRTPRGWSPPRRRRRPARRRPATGRRRHVRVVDRDVGELALEQPDQLVRQRVALVVGVGLERQAEHRDLAPSSDPSRRFMPCTRNSGTPSFTRETASSIPGALERSSREREVLAQARAGREARQLRSRRAGSRG